MKRKFGNLLMMLGAALVLGALALFLYNFKEANDAETAAVNLLPQLLDQIEERRDNPEAEDETEETVAYIPGTPLDLLDPSFFEMTEVEIDGYGYIGYLSIPDLGLDLPVMGDWDYSRLKIAPCRYSGTARGENLVIMAHNYNRHFGGLSELTEGDSVTFTDMDGILHEYEVVAKDILMPNAVEEMTAGEYDLVLFTCTYGGRTRVTVYCDRVKTS